MEVKTRLPQAWANLAFRSLYKACGVQEVPQSRVESGKDDGWRSLLPGCYSAHACRHSRPDSSLGCLFSPSANELADQTPRPQVNVSTDCANRASPSSFGQGAIVAFWSNIRWLAGVSNVAGSIKQEPKDTIEGLGTCAITSTSKGQTKATTGAIQGQGHNLPMALLVALNQYWIRSLQI